MSVLARICALLCLPLLMTAAARADDVDLSALHFDKPTCLVEQKDNPCKALVCELTACTGEKWTDRSGDTQTQMGRMMAASQACRAEHPQLVADLKRCQTEARSARDEQARRQRNKTVEGDREMMSWYEADAAIPRLAANHAREIFDWARHELAVQAESALQPGGRYAGKGPAPDRARLDALRAVESGFRDGKMWFKDWHEESRDYGDACQVWWAFERKHHPCCPYPPGFNDANAVLGLAWQDTFGTTSRALTMMYKDDPQTRQAAARVLGASGWAKVAALESLQDEQLGAMLDRTEQVCLGKTPAARVEVRIAVSLPGHRSQQDIRQFSDALGEVTLGGRIQDASGNPLPGANITVSSGAAPSGQTVARSGADGRWEARVQIGSNGSTRQDGIDFTLTSTGVRLVARQDAAGEGEIVIPCGDADGVLQVRAGQVVDSFGKPVAGAEIGVADQAAGVWSDAQGRFTFKAGIGSASGICNAPADTRISLAFPLQIEAATTHAALPGVTGSDTIPAAWVFAQAEDLPLDLNFSVDGQGIHPGKLRIEAISPVAGKFRIDSLGGRWADAAPGQFHWDGILPAHATLSTAARDWTLLISAEYVDPVSKRTLKGELRRPFRVIEDPRLSAAELKANFDWIAAWWKSHTEDGIVRKEGDSLLDGLQHDAGNLLRTGLSGFGSWGYPSWGLGPYNNFALNYGTRSGSARHEQLLNYTCGAYTARTLNTLNRLRYSDDPAVRRRFLGIEYTPITHWPASVDGNDWYNHVAVLLYAQGYAHLKHATALNLEPGGDAPGSIRPRGGLATVLEPWWDQTAELMPIDAWMDKFVSGGAAGGRIGIMEALTDWASAARVPGVAHSQYAGAEIDKAGSSIDTRPVAGAARSRYLSSLSPVHLLVSDAQGRRFGFDAQGQAVREIPGAEFEIWPAGDGHRIEHLYLPEGDYTLSVQGAADGHFGLVLSDADNGLAYFPDDTPIRAGETVHLALPGDAPPAAITLADGALVQPKLAGGIPATRSGAIAAPESAPPVDAVTACQHAKDVWAQAVRNWHSNDKSDAYQRTMLLARKQYNDCMLKHAGVGSGTTPDGGGVGVPSDDLPPLPAGATLVTQTGFGSPDTLNDWGGAAKDRKVSDGVAAFRSGNHDAFLLKRKVPLENVVFEWRGTARENGFHGSFGPYHFNLGGWNNNGAGYHGPGVQFVKVPAGKVYIPGQFQHYRIERIGDRYRARVDDRLIFDAVIPGRADTREGEFRFTTYNGGLQLDWFRVYTVPDATQSSLAVRDFGLAADAPPALPDGACLAYGSGFDSVAALGDWGGTATKRVVSEGIAGFRSEGHKPFSLITPVPVEDVVLEWRGSAKGNGFHGHLGPYHFNLGGWGNNGAGYSGPGAKFVKVNVGKVYEDAKLHHYRLERLGDHWRASIDGRELFDGVIPQRSDKPTGELRFTSYGSDLRLDWVRVWHPQCPHPVSPAPTTPVTGGHAGDGSATGNGTGTGTGTGAGNGGDAGTWGPLPDGVADNAAHQVVWSRLKELWNLSEGYVAALHALADPQWDSFAAGQRPTVQEMKADPGLKARFQAYLNAKQAPNQALERMRALARALPGEWQRAARAGDLIANHVQPAVDLLQSALRNALDTHGGVIPGASAERGLRFDPGEAELVMRTLAKG